MIKSPKNTHVDEDFINERLVLVITVKLTQNQAFPLISTPNVVPFI
jgi:hypothetical protein